MNPRSGLALALAAIGGCAIGAVAGRTLWKTEEAKAPSQAETVIVEVEADRNEDPTPKKSTAPLMVRGSRLSALSQLIRRVNGSSVTQLWALNNELMARDQAGGETSLERAIVMYRLGQLDGANTVRRTFRTDPDRIERQYTTVLEGWAQQDPTAAYDWWQSIPPGSLRTSLLDSLLQGCSASLSDWSEILLTSIGIDELGMRAINLLDAVIEEDGLADAATLFAEHFHHRDKNHYFPRQRLILLLARRATTSKDPDAMKHISRW